MIVLDTDHISLLQRPDSPEARILTARLTASTDRGIFTTVATVEEQMRGWLRVIARYRDPRQQVTYYDGLIGFMGFFAKWRILRLDESAVEVLQDLKQARIRISTTDLKIAAITLANGALLLSRNLRDFQQVPELRVEDWTKSA
jgi:tRNA(fMet)-specific endonuclease VapC